ncbi:MAG: response regulator transcription factor [Desulfobacterales bacterium]|nr:response regulator transcription factor [Desulfobacterales bacterium]
MQKIKILLVEDDEILMRGIAGSLLLDGFDVRTANTAADFMDLVKRDRFDVAVIDIGLPDSSGFELVNYLKENTGLGIIILTGREDINDKIRGYEAGTDLYFVKPIHARELSAAIVNLVDRICRTGNTGGHWSFHPSLRLLESPDCQKIHLTTKEFIFIQALARAEGTPVTRDVLCRKLEYSDDPIQANRAIDVLVARLRKKIKTHTSASSPLTTIHSVGFMISAQVK